MAIYCLWWRLTGIAYRFRFQCNGKSKENRYKAGKISPVTQNVLLSDKLYDTSYLHIYILLYITPYKLRCLYILISNSRNRIKRCRGSNNCMKKYKVQGLYLNIFFIY
jgi:hypothetical protein